jgi:hypothetical protein
MANFFPPPLLVGRVAARRYVAGLLLLGGLLASAWGFSSCQHSTNTMSDYKSEKFKLSASPAAPDGYQMVIFTGTFHRSDGQTFPVPSGHRLISGWEGSSISWAVGEAEQPAPDSLALVWYSTTEDKFYEGHFLLPQERIHTLLKTGFWNTEEQKQQTYDELTVLVGLKGMAVVWLTGGQNKVLIGRFQAQETTSRFPNQSAQEHAQILQEERAELSPAVQQQIREGTISSKKWEDYLRVYPWKIVFNQPLKLYNYGIDYLNAERTNYPATRDMAQYAQGVLEPSLKAVPRDLDLFVETEAGQRYEIRVVAFDETETMGAFQALHQADAQRPIVLTVELDKPFRKAQLVLDNGTQKIPLANTKVEVFAAE